MKLTFESGPRAGQVVSVDPGRSVSIGRDPSADIFVDDARVSRPHARIWVDSNGGGRIEDLRSTNGTFVNGQRLEGAAPLTAGDVVAIGNTRLVVAGEAPAGEVTVVAATPVVARTTSPSMVIMRDTVKRANRTSRLAMLAVAVLAVGVIATAAWYVVAGRPPTNDEIVDRMLPSIVRISVQDDSGAGSGTGWVLDAGRGLIVTNNHVINGGQRVTVSGEGITPRSANIVAAAPCDDVAIIHVDDNAGLASARVGSQVALAPGDDLLALGYPLTGSAERNLVVTEGTASVISTRFDGGEDIPDLPSMIQHTARVNPGNSGGPLLNRAGEVVGMNTVLIESLDQNYAVGSDRVLEIADGLSSGNGIGWTGMGLEWPTTATLAELGFPAIEGLLVTSVTPGTEADIRGFGEFPVLVTAIDGHPVKDLPTYCDAVAGQENGEESSFTVAIVDSETLQVFTADVPVRFR